MTPGRGPHPGPCPRGPTRVLCGAVCPLGCAIALVEGTELESLAPPPARESRRLPGTTSLRACSAASAGFPRRPGPGWLPGIVSWSPGAGGAWQEAVQRRAAVPDVGRAAPRQAGQTPGTAGDRRQEPEGWLGGRRMPPAFPRSQVISL